MTKEEKNIVVEELREKFDAAGSFYITDAAGLSVAQVNALRRKCFEDGVEYKVAKNTLIKIALDNKGGEELSDNYKELFKILKGPTSIFFTDIANKPAKIIKEFRIKNDKPVIKAAFIDNEIYLGDENLGMLASLKSKEELVGDIIGLLQSPLKTVISALQSSGNKLSGLLKTLSERTDDSGDVTDGAPDKGAAAEAAPEGGSEETTGDSGDSTDGGDETQEGGETGDEVASAEDNNSTEDTPAEDTPAEDKQAEDTGSDNTPHENNGDEDGGAPKDEKDNK